MKIKVSDATTIQLDWLVTGLESVKTYGVKDWLEQRPYFKGYRWSGDWSQVGYLIERVGMGVWMYQWNADGEPEAGWYAEDKDGNHVHKGPTPLIAAVRCYVASRLGDEVEIPKELI